MIDRDHDLPICRQAELVGISRGVIGVRSIFVVEADPKIYGRKLTYIDLTPVPCIDLTPVPGESVQVDQVLVDRRGVALQAQLRLDELAVPLARRGRAQGRRSRWPGWGNLRRRAGGHPGGICSLRGKAPVVQADRLAIDPREPLDLALGRPARSSVQIVVCKCGFKTFTPFPSVLGGLKVTSCQTPAAVA
jgi:hypothetical protein